MINAAIYARVSTERQEQQRTIDSQLAELRRISSQRELNLVEEYVDDGYSGANLARPGLDRLRDDVSKGRFQTVLILSPDRLARNYPYQVLVIEELRKQGIEVVFLDKPVTDKPEDQLMLAMQGAIAEYERALIIERTRRGRLHKARCGEFVGGTPPFGYDRLERSKNTPAHLVVNEEEARVVRLIFSLYIRHSVSTMGIARELMRRVIRTRKGMSRWWPSCVVRILRNECYAGRAFYNKRLGSSDVRKPRSEWIPLKVPQIVDEETFDLTQRTLEVRRRTDVKPGSPLRVYVLSGLVKCARCGTRYSGFTSRREGFSYYRCTNPQKMRPFPKTCDARTIRAERIEQGVIGALKALIDNPEIMMDHLLDVDRSVRQRSGGRHEIRRLGKRRRLLEQQKQKLLDLYLEGSISKGEYGERNQKIEQGLDALATELSQAVQETPKVDRKTIEQSLERFSSYARKKLDGLSPEEMRTFLTYVIDEVTFDSQTKDIRIAGHVPVGRGEALYDLSGIWKPAKSNQPLSFEISVRV